MKNLKQYITEKLKITKDNIFIFEYHPKNFDELNTIVKERITEAKKRGDEIIDLTNIDTSKIQTMQNLFRQAEVEKIDVSGWDTSNVKNMIEMFRESSIKDIIGISNWDVSKVLNMEGMFQFCRNLNKDLDLSNWDVSNVISMKKMFLDSSFNSNISDWDVSNVENMREMFCGSTFNNDISKWDVSNVENMYQMFADSLFDQDISNWTLHKDCCTKYTYLFENSPIELHQEKWPKNYEK